MQYRAREARNGNADRRRLRIVAGTLQNELFRKAFDPFRLADYQPLAPDGGADNPFAIGILRDDQIVLAGYPDSVSARSIDAECHNS